MSSIMYSPVKIQTSSQSVPTLPSWFGEVTLLAHYLTQLGLLEALSEQVRLARRRFGHYKVIDFFAVLIGYALSGESTLETFYQRLLPFATPFIALCGRERLPHRSTLSRFLAALDQSSVNALRTLFQKDLLARPLTQQEEYRGGLWERSGVQWLVFDVDGTRQAARQRALPQTPDLPPIQRRFDRVCAPGYLGRKRGEAVRTRTTILQAHTHQWLGPFGGRGNGDYRGELLHAAEAIAAYLIAQQIPFSQGIVRLDGQYGNGAIVEDLQRLGLAYVMRGKDYDLLDLPADQQTTHPETGTCRTLFDCLDVPLTATGVRGRVIVATHAATSSGNPAGTTRDALVYELFYTAFKSLVLPTFTLLKTKSAPHLPSQYGSVLAHSWRIPWDSSSRPPMRASLWFLRSDGCFALPLNGCYPPTPCWDELSSW